MSQLRKSLSSKRCYKHFSTRIMLLKQRSPCVLRLQLRTEQCKKERTYCTILFSLLLLGFGLLQWSAKQALAFKIQKSHFFFSDSVYQTLLHLQILETLHCSFNLYEAHLSSHWLWTFYKPVELPAWWLSNSDSKTFRESLSFHQIQCANIFRFWEH